MGKVWEKVWEQPVDEEMLKGTKDYFWWKALAHRVNESKGSISIVQWHPYPKEKPKKPGTYLITSVWGDEPEVGILPFVEPVFTFADSSITAWAELPAPYKEDGE